MRPAPLSICWPALAAALRSALAAQAAYDVSKGTEDRKAYSLESLSEDRMLEIGVDAESAAAIAADHQNGFEVALYQDYIAGEGKYILAFAGTDSWTDIVDNAQQASGIGEAPEYEQAMEIAAGLAASPVVGEWYATGHSLGGGLASAAAVVSGHRAETVNAAGLAEDTLLDENGNEIYPNSLIRFNPNVAATFIDAYFVDYDVLNLVQDAYAGLPDAVGNRVELDGPYDLLVAAELAFIYSGQSVTSLVGGAGFLYHTTQCHFKAFCTACWSTKAATKTCWAIFKKRSRKDHFR